MTYLRQDQTDIHDKIEALFRNRARLALAYHHLQDLLKFWPPSCLG